MFAKFFLVHFSKIFDTYSLKFMFRSRHPVDEDVFTVCVSSPLYVEFVDDLIDDLISVRFNIIQKISRRLCDDEVADWFRISDCNESDSETAAQYTNGISEIFLLSRANAILVGERVAKVHNEYSILKIGKSAVYFSPNIVEAYRDIRIHFSQFADRLRAPLGDNALEEARAYARKYLMNPLAFQLSQTELSSMTHNK